MERMTPMMRQYYEIKERNSDCILFFRLGDFYEMFGDDARTASRELDLTLTSRDKSTEDPEARMPMCGIPYHSSEAYIARLIAKGYKVAICEQLEDAAEAKGLVERDVVRIVTPGTLIDASMLDEERPNYLCALYMGDDGAAACFSDLSTGEISLTEFSGAETGPVINELEAYGPAEVILSAGAQTLLPYIKGRMQALCQLADTRFEAGAAAALVRGRFEGGEASLSPGGPGERAVGALLSYIADTQKADTSHIRTLKIKSKSDIMELDVQTVRSLELTASQRTFEKRGSLLWVLDRTKTPMGRRLIRAWVLRPLLSPLLIKRRQDAVGELYFEMIARDELIRVLREIGDMERLIGRIVYGSAGSRDLRALSASLRKLPELAALLAPMKSALLTGLKEMDILSDVEAEIERFIDDDPPFSVREGGFIRDGADEGVDRLRGLLTGSTQVLQQLEARERERTGKKLKVGYNKVFGYYIEIPRSASEDVPEDYIRKQTLTNSERFITQELKELETELLTARDKLCELEYRIFTELCRRVSGAVARIQDTAAAVAAVDVLCSLSEVAARNSYCRPEIDESGVIEIRDGRHPVVEQMQTEALFVPNDTFLDPQVTRTAIITGPNMAGKSTYMRQTALIVLMAQMGAFVPARSARIGIVDRVFTRIGASDDLSGGKSTFMVEMTEVSEILRSATKRSLLILDEIGRGTSTYDGMSVARAVLEHCTDPKKLGAKTLFATHYHELTGMETELPGIKNYNITAKKRGGEVIFLRKIVPGMADDSYGIEVAGLAGVPESVIRRAKAILAQLEAGGPAAPPLSPAGAERDQISLLDYSGEEVLEALRKTDLNTLTPIEALNLLYTLKKKVES